MPRYIVHILCSILSLVLLGVVAAELPPARVSVTDDLALAITAGDAVLHGTMPLMGPSSHLGGRHLGPLYFIYTAFCLWIGAGSMHYALVAMSFCKFLGIILLACLARNFARSPTEGWWYACGVLLKH